MGHDRIEVARSHLARHPVRVASDVRMTTQWSEQEVAGDLDQCSQRRERPDRGTQFGGRGEDERGCRDEDPGHDRAGLAATCDVTEDRKCRSERTQGGSGGSARHGVSVSPARSRHVMHA